VFLSSVEKFGGGMKKIMVIAMMMMLYLPLSLMQ